jgi:hypothetical protein
MRFRCSGSSRSRPHRPECRGRSDCRCWRVSRPLGDLMIPLGGVDARHPMPASRSSGEVMTPMKHIESALDLAPIGNALGISSRVRPEADARTVQLARGGLCTPGDRAVGHADGNHSVVARQADHHITDAKRAAQRVRVMPGSRHSPPLEIREFSLQCEHCSRMM